jgi:transcription elongation factor GreB
MSKAFTREDDRADQPSPRPMPLLPPGVKNFMTVAGRDRLQAELSALNEERPRLVESSLTDPELRAELAQLDHRINQLERSLASAEAVPVPSPPHDHVRFGSTVTVRDERGAEETYRIVGADEADSSRREISWRSPLAAAVLNARVGQKITFRAPAGLIQLKIIAIG